ncbi:MAG: Crp/Fnr family transcriptional regulator [Pseudomonadota bacterium]
MREYSVGTLGELENTLPTAEMTQLTLVGTRRAYGKGQTVYAQGDPAEAVYLLHTGEVKSVLTSIEGEACVLRLHLPCSLLGLTALATNPIRDATAVALGEVEVTQIHRDRFTKEMLRNPTLGGFVVRLLVDRMSDFHHRVGAFHTHTVEQRLATTLLSLARPDPQGTQVSTSRPIRLTHEDLAGLLGARRPTVTAVLNRFQTSGLVAKQGRAIVVIDADRLGALASGSKVSSA